MIDVEKIYTDNPFVDNVLYYCKIMALNSTVKDEDEALANETAESLENGDILIACIEGRAKYEMFKNIPREILEKYIPLESNLDVYVNNVDSLRVHLNSYPSVEKTILTNNLSHLARTIYIDHYDIMMNYLYEVGEHWLSDNLPLYNSCVAKTATYSDLFEIMPYHTRYRIIKTYLNNYDSSDLETIASSLSAFEAYIATRTDEHIETELDNITKAMRAVFISHYEIMMDRGYIIEDWNRALEFTCDMNVFRRCINGSATWDEIYPLCPASERVTVLEYVYDPEVIVEYHLNESEDYLKYYLANISENPTDEKLELNTRFMDLYMTNYNLYLNQDVYNKCKDGYLDYFQLIQYIPKETQKVILAQYIDEYTNLQVYSDNKNMLNSYLATLPAENRNEIKKYITADMVAWYPTHHVEKNNYYRALIGLPYMDSNTGYIYEDTLVHSYDANTNSFIEFGDRFISRIPEGIYPETHWKQPLCYFDSYDMGILREYGILEDWIAALHTTFDNPRYRYLKYLADEKLDLYTCRKAGNLDLIGIPTVDDDDVKRKFVQQFSDTRTYIIRTVYNDAYKFNSEYYNKFMIVFLLMNVIMDMLASIPEYIIDREVFDTRCIKYLFESYGIPYYSEIPVKYQKAMLKNLNILIKYKSATKNMIDICSLFGFHDVKVFGYYLFRDRIVDDSTGEYSLEENNNISYDLEDLWVRNPLGDVEDYAGCKFSRLLDSSSYSEDKYTIEVNYLDDQGVQHTKRIIDNTKDVYIRDEENNDFIKFKDADYFTKIKANTDSAELKFIKVPIDENLTEYKSDPNYIMTYDEIVYQDEGNTWDGGLDHKKLYKDLLDYEFNAVKSKYISVETVTEMTELAFQVSYFYNMLFDNFYSEDKLTLKIPFVKVGHEFRFMDVVCYLFALMYLYNDLEDNIMYSPTQILYIKGYNFNEDLNTVLQDPKAFTQYDSEGNPLPDYEKENIFDINTRIAEDGYDYREAFRDLIKIRGFNLEADIDELEKWLNDNFQMSLDDFVVDDSLETFDQIITLRSFFSLNNSYYQKDIFQDHIVPLQYNQNIKYAYDLILYKIEKENDSDGNKHRYVLENGNYYMEVIDNKNDDIYIMDYNKYINISSSELHPIYGRYTKDSNNNYNRNNHHFYIPKENSDEYIKLYDKNIRILNTNGDYIFSADAYYSKDADDNYTEITNPDFYYDDPYESDKKILKFGEYYIYRDGRYVLDPDNTYVIVTQSGQARYVLLSDTDSYQNTIVAEEDCYILQDGHFIPLVDTDYYTRTQEDTSDKFDEFVYVEKESYIISSEPTQYYDESVSPRVYYAKLTDYYSDNNYVVYRETMYVKDYNGHYINTNSIIDPNNCYYLAGEDYYELVYTHLGSFSNYTNPRTVSFILVLQEDNDYLKLSLDSNGNYVHNVISSNRYVLNSTGDFVTVLIPSAHYNDTKTMVVVFNKEVSNGNPIDIDPTGRKYNPEETDGKWDENDWFYPDPGYDDSSIGMNGENMWYYRKPGETDTPVEEETDSEEVGSGFYMEASAYIGDTVIEEGQRYYMSFDVETNFSGQIQICNTADASLQESVSRIYNVTMFERLHVDQVFTANSEQHPEIRFIIYDFDNYPIECGDYIIVKNIKFIKSYSDNFIAQDIPSYDKLQELYRTNEAIYKYLVTLMVNTSDKRTYAIYKKLYDSLMIAEYNKEAFKIGEDKYAKTYTDFLQTRDEVLYEKLVYLKGLDVDTMHKEVADQIIEVTYAIDDCVDTYSYGYLYSYFPAVSANYIQRYISLIINFFKSWKVHLLGINTVYKFDDKWENTIKILETEQRKNKYNEIKDGVHVYGGVKVNPIDGTNASGYKYTDIFEDLVQYSNYVNDFYRPKDRVRIIVRPDNVTKIIDNNLHVIFSNPNNEARDNNGNLVISSANDGFKKSDNILIISTDDSDQNLFSAQSIDEINKNSYDNIERTEDNNDE